MSVKIPILTDYDARGVKQAEASLSGLQKTAAAAGNSMRAAFVPAALAAGALAIALTSSVKAAMQDAASQENLAGVLRRTTQATADSIRQAEQFISSLSKQTATADDDLRPALARLVSATHDQVDAQKLLVISQDVAAASGKDLDTVTAALSKAYNGNFKALKMLDPSLGAVIKTGASFSETMTVLAKTTGGAAAAAANTTAGRMKALKIAIDETRETIGAAFLPILERLIPVLQRAAQLVQENSRTFLIATGVIAGTASAVIAINVAMRAYAVITKIATAAQFLFNAVVKANIFVRLALAIASVVVAYEVVTTSSQGAGAAMARFGKMAQVIGGAIVAIFARVVKVVATAGFLLVKAGGFFGKILDPIIGTNLGGRAKEWSAAVDRFGQGVHDLEMNAISFANGDSVGKVKSGLGRILDAVKTYNKSSSVEAGKAVFPTSSFTGFGSLPTGGGGGGGSAKSPLFDVDPIGSMNKAHAIYDKLLAKILKVKAIEDAVTARRVDVISTRMQQFNTFGPLSGGNVSGLIAAQAAKAQAATRTKLDDLSFRLGLTNQMGPTSGFNAKSFADDRDRVQAAAEKLKKAGEDAARIVGGAFATVAAKSMRAFTSETAAGLERMAGSFDTQVAGIRSRLAVQLASVNAALASTMSALDRQEGALTPAEQALATAEATRTQMLAARTLAGAESQLAAARTAGDQVDIAAAELALADVRQNQAIDALQILARDERDAARDRFKAARENAQALAAIEQQNYQTAAQAEEDAAQKSYNQLVKNYRSERDLQEEHLTLELEALKTSLEQQPTAWQAIHKKVMALFSDSFGPDYKTVGANMGSSFVTGLFESFGKVGAAALAGSPSLTTAGALLTSSDATVTAARPAATTIINVAGVITEAQAGQAIVNALRRFNQVTGPIQIKVA